MSIPNLITFARLLAVPFAIYLILQQELGWAFWLFVAAGLSDALDGAIARLCQMQTKLGAWLDPIADKALLVSVYLSLAHINELPLWLAILVVFRDALIVGGVLLAQALKEPLTMQPLAVSKLNTAVQIALVAAVLAPPGLNLPDPQAFGVALVTPMVWLAAATTAASGAAYLWRGYLLFERHGRAG